MVRRYCFISCFIFVFQGTNSIANGQIASDLNFITTHNPINPVRVKKSTPFNFGETNELKVALMSLIRGYQLFISTQDMPVCNFTPSCSMFGMDSFKKYGIFYGFLMTSDRLQRCHGCHGRERKYYHLHPKTGKSDDPVEHNFLGNK